MGILPGPQSDRSPFECPPARVERPQRHPSGGALDYAGRRASGRGGRGVACRVLHGLAFVVARDQRPGFAAEKFAVAAVPEEVVAVDANRAARVQREMTSRLEAEPGVAADLVLNLPGRKRRTHPLRRGRRRHGSCAVGRQPDGRHSTCSMFTAPSSRLGVVSLPATLVRRTRSS